MLSVGIENLVQGASAMGDVRHLPQRGALQEIGNLAGDLQGPKAPAKAATPRPELDVELEAQFDSLLTGVRRGNDLRIPVAPIGKLPIAEAQITPEQPMEPAAELAVVETAVPQSPRLALRDVALQLRARAELALPAAYVQVLAAATRLLELALLEPRAAFPALDRWVQVLRAHGALARDALVLRAREVDFAAVQGRAALARDRVLKALAQLWVLLRFGAARLRTRGVRASAPAINSQVVAAWVSRAAEARQQLAGFRADGRQRLAGLRLAAVSLAF